MYIFTFNINTFNINTFYLILLLFIILVLQIYKKINLLNLISGT